jgi:hypothetical protein
LIETGHFPRADWTIWDEFIKTEKDALKNDRKRGISEEDDEQSQILKRIRQFQKVHETVGEIDQTQFDRYAIRRNCDTGSNIE